MNHDVFPFWSTIRGKHDFHFFAVCTCMTCTIVVKYVDVSSTFLMLYFMWYWLFRHWWIAKMHLYLFSFLVCWSVSISNKVMTTSLWKCYSTTAQIHLSYELHFQFLMLTLLHSESDKSTTVSNSVTLCKTKHKFHHWNPLLH